MVCTLLNVRKSHLASMKCKKTLGSRGFAPDPAGGGGGYSDLQTPSWWRGGWLPSPKIHLRCRHRL